MLPLLKQKLNLIQLHLKHASSRPPKRREEKKNLGDLVQYNLQIQSYRLKDRIENSLLPIIFQYSTIDEWLARFIPINLIVKKNSIELKPS